MPPHDADLPRRPCGDSLDPSPGVAHKQRPTSFKKMRRSRLALAGAAAPATLLLFSLSATATTRTTEAFSSSSSSSSPTTPRDRRWAVHLLGTGGASSIKDDAASPLFSRHAYLRRKSGTTSSSIFAAPFDDDGETSTTTATAAVVGVNGGEDESTDINYGSPPPPDPPGPPPRKRNFRMQLFSYLNLPPVEVASAMAVILSSFLVAVGTLQDLPTIPGGGALLLGQGPSPGVDAHILIDHALDSLNVLFAIDFFVRWYAAGNFKPKYLTKPLVTLDVIVVLIPLFLGSLIPFLDSLGVADGHTGTLLPQMLLQKFDSGAGLQNLLLLRILRLRRVLTDINTFSRFEMALGIRPNDVRPYQLQLARVLLSVFTLLSVASGLIYTTEHGVNPDIPDYFAALYFGLTTLTTVGFGDIAPITPEGRLVVCLSILAGVAVVPAQAAALVDAIVEFQGDRMAKKGGPGQRVTVRAPGSANRKEPEEQVSSSLLREAAAAAAAAEEAAVREPAVIASEDTPLAVALAAAALTEERELVGWLGRCCLECEEADHREDASFCWSCGSRL